jgi:hypothetical protein
MFMTAKHALYYAILKDHLRNFMKLKVRTHRIRQT